MHWPIREFSDLFEMRSKKEALGAIGGFNDSQLTG